MTTDTADASPPETRLFKYEAQSPGGATLRGTMDATSAAEAQAALAALDLRVLLVEPAPDSARRRTPLGPDEFLAFNQQLAHLTAAGLPVERGLRLIAADMVAGRLARAARDVADDLERGVALPEAFAKHATRFPPLYGRLVEAGVQASNLPAMLFNMGHHLELVGRLRQALLRTLAYPIMVLAGMSLVLLFISLVVLPPFEDMYADFRTTLPAVTRFIFFCGHLYPYVWGAGVVLVAAAIVTAFLLRMTGKAGAFRDHVGIRIPVIGRVLRASLLARWVDALRLGIEAGLDLPRAIELASQATASRRIAAEGRAMAEAIAAGQSPYLFGGHLIPPTVPAAIELAGHSGDLSATLAMLTRMYHAQAEHRIRLVPVLITPLALIVIAGTLVIAIAALFLPLVMLIRSVSGGG